jgi:hypothetical protein
MRNEAGIRDRHTIYCGYYDHSLYRKFLTINNLLIIHCYAEDKYILLRTEGGDGVTSYIIQVWPRR